MVLTATYALKKSILGASLVLNKAPDKINLIDNAKKNRVRKLLEIQFMDNHLPATEITQ